MRQAGRDIKQSGFTLLEIIAVLVVLGILTAVVASRAGDVTSEAERIGDMNRIIAHLRYVQARSMEDCTRVYGIYLRGNQYIAARYPTAPTTVAPPNATQQIRLPGENQAWVTLGSDIRLKGGAQLVAFTDLGQPINAGTPSKFKLKFRNSSTINIANETGYIK